jgi:hypothetical protein
VKARRKEDDFANNMAFNMDETPVYFDVTAEQTDNKMGVKMVELA